MARMRLMRGVTDMGRVAPLSRVVERSRRLRLRRSLTQRKAPAGSRGRGLGLPSSGRRAITLSCAPTAGLGLSRGREALRSSIQLRRSFASPS